MKNEALHDDGHDVLGREATADIDVVLLMRVDDIAALQAAFPAVDYYVPPDETLRLELARSARGTFNLIHHPSQFKADVYLAVAASGGPLNAVRGIVVVSLALGVTALFAAAAAHRAVRAAARLPD